MMHFRKIQQYTAHGSKTGYRCGGTGGVIGSAYIAPASTTAPAPASKTGGVTTFPSASPAEACGRGC